MEREQAFDAPHLLPCSDCGAANGRNALRCWNCSAELPGARQREQTPLLQPLPAADHRATRTRRTKPRARRRVGTAIAVAVVLALATFVWTPPPEDRDVVRDLGVAQRQPDGAQTAPGRQGCSLDDLALGRCAVESPPAQSSPAEPAPAEPFAAQER